jgi:hypothetical protein
MLNKLKTTTSGEGGVIMATVTVSIIINILATAIMFLYTLTLI